MRSAKKLTKKLFAMAAQEPEGSKKRNILAECANRLQLQHMTIENLLEECEYATHNCKDLHCPVMAARQVYCLGGK